MPWTRADILLSETHSLHRRQQDCAFQAQTFIVRAWGGRGKLRRVSEMSLVVVSPE